MLFFYKVILNNVPFVFFSVCSGLSIYVPWYQSKSERLSIACSQIKKRFLEPGYSSGSLMPRLRHYLSTVRVEWLKRCALFITNSPSFATLDHRQWWSIVWTAVSDEGSRTLSDLIYRHFCRCTLREGALNLKLLPFYFFFHLNPYFLISLRESWCGILNCISYFDRPRLHQTTYIQAVAEDVAAKCCYFCCFHSCVAEHFSITNVCVCIAIMQMLQLLLQSLCGYLFMVKDVGKEFHIFSYFISYFLLHMIHIRTVVVS